MRTLQVISLGAGVQSTTLALMATLGEITPMPDCAIFADTGWEPPEVYEHLAWLESGFALSFPVYRVSAGNIRDDVLGERFSAMPFHVLDAKGKRGMGKRQCTRRYKTRPIKHKVRELLGKGRFSPMKPGIFVNWLGISLDELVRAVPSSLAYEARRFPLLEARMTREDCITWLRRRGYPVPPKSSCVGCPYHAVTTWRAMKERTPQVWDDAVRFDRKIRNRSTRRGAQQFLVRQCVPLEEADLSDTPWSGHLHECEGICMT